MARIKGAHTGPELRLRKALWRSGLRYRLQRRDLPGSPDIVFSPRRLAIFVHGCFWHRHDCAAGRRSVKTNQSFWEAKFTANVERDRRVRSDLAAIGWRELVVWECELRRDEHVARAVERVMSALSSP